LDTKTGEQILTLLEQLHKKKGKTLIIVTHDMYVAKRAGRIITLKDGEVV
jgi:ABC-type lipoprotein export system ATPase subunit